MARKKTTTKTTTVVIPEMEATTKEQPAGGSPGPSLLDDHERAKQRLTEQVNREPKEEDEPEEEEPEEEGEELEKGEKDEEVNKPVVVVPPTTTIEGPAANKTEAVRRIILENPEIKPKEAVEILKARFNIDMSTAHFSTYKSQLQKKARDNENGGDGGASPHPRKKSEGGSYVRLDRNSTIEVGRALKVLIADKGLDAVQDVVHVCKLYGVSAVEEVLELLALLSDM